MEETKIIYHLDDQDTPYLVKLPIPAGKVTLLDLKNALNRPNYKYYFKSMDDDFGVVKEEIIDDAAYLPSYNGRVVTWLVSAEGSSVSGSVSDTKSQGAAEPVNDADGDKSASGARLAAPSARAKPPSGKPDSQPTMENKKAFGPSQRQQNAVRSNGNSRHHDAGHRSRHAPASSVMSIDIETTSFVDSDDDNSTRMSTTTADTSEVSSRYNHRRRRRKHRMPVMSHASSISSITDSTMSLNIITVVLNMDTANFLGISIVGQSNKAGDGGIYVGSIMKGGAVALDSRIEPGDMILEVNGVSFERMSNDDAVRTLREAVQRPGPITLVVAKCWDPNPKGYFTIPRQEPVRPIDPSVWVNHTEAMRGMGSMGMWGRTGAPSMSTITSTSSSLISSLPANEYLPRRTHSSATSSSSHSSKSFTDMNLTKHTDMAAVVRVMAQPDSGLEVRDRMWLKITIPHAFIGSELVDWLYSHVDGFVDRRDARRYACNLLKAGFIQHTVNKVTFSEQCYYIFGTSVPCKDIAALSLEDIDSISSIGQRDTVGPLPPSAAPSWGMPYGTSRPYTPSYLATGPSVPMNYGLPATPYNFVNDSGSYVSMPGMTGAESMISGSAKRDRTCACIVSHTYKQIRKLWDNNDKANPNQKQAMRMVGKFDADIDRSTSSDTGSSDSENGGNRDGNERKLTGQSSGGAGPSGIGSGEQLDGGLRSRQLPPPPVDRGLPKPPQARGLENVNPDMNASRQSFRIAMGNAYTDDTLEVMGDL